MTCTSYKIKVIGGSAIKSIKQMRKSMRSLDGAIDELVVSPIPNWIILLSYTFGGVVRGIIAGMLALFVAMFFSKIQPVNIPLALLIAVLASMLFSLAGFINALFANDFDQISIFPNFILTPLIYLGGVFYSIEILPDTWQIISKFNPIFYIIDAFRCAILGTGTTSIKLSLFSIIAFILLLYILAIFFMRLPNKLQK